MSHEESQSEGPGPKMSDVRPRHRRSSASTGSVRELLGVSYSPPPREQDPFTAGPFERSKGLQTLVHIARPLEVKKVEGRHQARALVVYYVLLCMFGVYCVFLLQQAIQARHNPPTTLAFQNQTWALPSLVICDRGVSSVYNVLHSGFSRGYPQTDAKEAFRKRVVALDSHCPGWEGCLFLDYSDVRAAGWDSTRATREMTMDIVYTPVMADQGFSELTADVFTTEASIDGWCKPSAKSDIAPLNSAKNAIRRRSLSDVKDAHTDDVVQGSFRIMVARPVSRSDRNHAQVTLETNHSFECDGSAVHCKRGKRNTFTVTNIVLDVWHIDKMVDTFTWFSTCNRSELVKGATDCYNQDPAQRWADVTFTDTRIILLTLVQDEFVNVYTQQDPVDLLTLAANAGGFWSYVAGVFSLLFVMNEAGRRRAAFFLRKKTWQRATTVVAEKLPLGVVRRGSEASSVAAGVGRRESFQSSVSGEDKSQSTQRRKQKKRPIPVEDRVSLLEDVMRHLLDAPVLSNLAPAPLMPSMSSSPVRGSKMSQQQQEGQTDNASSDGGKGVRGPAPGVADRETSAVRPHGRGGERRAARRPPPYAHAHTYTHEPSARRSSSYGFGDRFMDVARRAVDQRHRHQAPGEAGQEERNGAQEEEVLAEVVNR